MQAELLMVTRVAPMQDRPEMLGCLLLATSAMSQYPVSAHYQPVSKSPLVAVRARQRGPGSLNLSIPAPADEQLHTPTLPDRQLRLTPRAGPAQILGIP